MDFESARANGCFLVCGAPSDELDCSIQPLVDWNPVTSTPKRRSTTRLPEQVAASHSGSARHSNPDWNVTALQKEARASDAGFCSKCISDRHVGEQCGTETRCRVCFGNHHHLLCEGPSDIFNSCCSNNTNSLSLSVASRPTGSVKELRASAAGFCAKCLSERHTTENCASRAECRVCSGNHHHALCENGSEIFNSYIDDVSTHSLSFSVVSRPTGSVKELRATAAGFCAKCLSERHTTETCGSRVECRVCSGNHHHALCENGSDIFEEVDYDYSSADSDFL